VLVQLQLQLLKKFQNAFSTQSPKVSGDLH